MLKDNEALYILLADDDENDRLFFKEALEGIKVKTVVKYVKDGLQLMDCLNQPGARLPNVVFLDLKIPVKNEMDCLSEIRKNSKLKDLVVVIYSTDASEKNIEEAFIKGANIYIKKPDDFLVLKSCLSQVINVNWQYHTLGLNKENFLMKV